MKKAKKYLTIFTTLCFMTSAFWLHSQDLVAVNQSNSNSDPITKKADAPITPSETPSHYQGKDGHLYWQKQLPVFLFVSENPDGKDAKKLKSEANPEYTNPLYLDTEGVNYIRTRWAVDSEGNKIMPEREVMLEIYADGIAPITKIDLSAKKYSSKGVTYYGNSLETSLNSFDQMSGVKKINASIDNAAYETISGSFKIEEEGEHVIKYFATDNVGNSEVERSVSFVVDLSAPTTELAIDDEVVANILSPKDKLLFTSEDKLSGVKNIYYEFDELPKSRYTGPIYLKNVEEGMHRIVYYAEDHVGNIEASKDYRFFLDKTPAVVKYEVSKDLYEKDGSIYMSSRSSVTLNAEDNKAGVGEVYYALGKNKFQLYESPIPANDITGPNYLRFYGVDKVSNGNNMEFFQTYGKKMNFVVDNNGPEISHSFSGKKLQSRDTTFITSATKLSIKALDDISGVNTLNYSVNNGSSLKYDEPLGFDKEGLYTVEVSSNDQVNNSSSHSLLFVVDNTGPEITSIMGSEKVGTIDLDEEGKLDVYSKGVHIYLAATDKVIETQDIYFKLNEASKTRFVNPIVLNEKGINSIIVSAFDKLGNPTKEETEIKVFIK